ncbi:ER membrane protein complex subunit 5 [Gracilinanus agilis]|uniref:ER membrane protein complex subunit 5 n=1 Tax=Gracilinanus agilis TaxID=191870 RepID=UPI001CFCB2A3|nr:ER membrane protein complex subunit 5 [Gracilinanus agilis]
MAAFTGKWLVGLGLIILSHSAFSVAQHRTYMRLTEKEGEALPRDIILQTLLAFLITLYGIVQSAGDFRELDATLELENRTSDSLRNHPSFCIFNHRGRVLFRTTKTIISSSSSSAASTPPKHAAPKPKKVKSHSR